MPLFQIHRRIVHRQNHLSLAQLPGKMFRKQIFLKNLKDHATKGLGQYLTSGYLYVLSDAFAVACVVFTLLFVIPGVSLPSDSLILIIWMSYI